MAGNSKECIVCTLLLQTIVSQSRVIKSHMRLQCKFDNRGDSDHANPGAALTCCTVLGEGIDDLEAQPALLSDKGVAPKAFGVTYAHARLRISDYSSAETLLRTTEFRSAFRGDDHRWQISGLLSIHMRPPEIQDRQVPGFWEGELINVEGNASTVGTLVKHSRRRPSATSSTAVLSHCC